MIGNAIRPPLAVSAPPGPIPTPPDRQAQPGIAAHPFADLLRQNRLAEAPHAVTHAPPAAPLEAKEQAADSGESPQAPASAVSASQRDANQARSRATGAAGTARAVPRPSPAPSGSGDTPATARAGRDEDRAAALVAPDSGAAAGLAGIAAPGSPQRADPGTGHPNFGTGATAQVADNTRGPDAAAEGRAEGAIAPASDAPGSAPARESEGRHDAARSSAAASAASERRTARIGHGDGEGEATSAPFQQALAESKTASVTAGSASGEGRALGHAALAALAAEPSHNGTAAAEVATAPASLPVPVDSVDFAAAFGLRVSVLAKEGIQHAELHLNPSDMGPVSIQITLDGTQARVDFGADAAATRQAIESGLPELASALRDAGFTLSGGGVAQHSRPGGGQADDAEPADSAARRAAPGPVARLDAAAQRAARPASAGGIDLYA